MRTTDELEKENDSVLRRLASNSHIIYLRGRIPEASPVLYIMDKPYRVNVTLDHRGYHIALSVRGATDDSDTYEEGWLHYCLPMVKCPLRYTAAQRKKAAMKVFRNNTRLIVIESAEFSDAVDAIVADSFFRFR